MRYGKYKLTFYEGRYGNGRRAIVAMRTNGEEYGDVTINLPDHFLNDGDTFFNADSDDLVTEMEKQGFVEVYGSMPYGFGTYKIGRFTDKFEAIVKEMK